MSEWAAKRFWTDTQVAEVEGGFEVRLDGRPVRTPFKSPLHLPTRAVAELLAGEWEAQSGTIDPNSMPATRMANSAIEKVAPQCAAVIAHLASYGETDLLCYRAESPEGLVALQAEAWDPWLDWARDTYGAELTTTRGVLPVTQPREAIDALTAPMAAMGPFELAAFHDLVSLPGSLILGLAAAAEAAAPEPLWQAARLDEVWQIEQWGHDDEAEAVNAHKLQAFMDAAVFLRAVRSEAA
ncbi:ATP12 family chaperone protein [Ovoidimarina sediminis]|uniref:ATP12 family chaperone protein n=1 Tax=Ovoidimarina sediminis TaxID=3079856 RepID=UPI002910DC32|nr:ATP12 family protein [Rhodophyticola sp. MJ-SS7]MDU8946310.1 ATP12 family protein [Rhodophyticola sp. MJ-SS7]